MFKDLIVLFLILNALFWGLFPHSTHCLLVSKLTSMTCPPHFVHLIMGITFFVLAVLLANLDYFQEVYKGAVQVAGATAEAFSTIVQKGGEIVAELPGKSIELKIK
jgi:hypothetical protein